MLAMIMQDPNVRWILMATLLLGISSGVLGSFAFLRKQSLMGDALAHAALPGVCIAFMLSGTRSMLFFMIGAVIAGLIATLVIGFVTRLTKLKQDAALAIVLSVFFGLGIVLLTHIQHHFSGNQSGLDTFLFGQAATMVMDDVYVLAIAAIILIGLIMLFFKEFKLISFDPGFARGLGLPVAWLEQLLMLLIVFAVVIGIKAVGVVLMAALLIIPAVAARYWTEKLGVMVMISGFFGAISGVTGTLLSTLGNHLPTGPLIVLSAAFIFVVSLIFAPKRGLLGTVVIRRIAKNSLDTSRQTDPLSMQKEVSS